MPSRVIGTTTTDSDGYATVTLPSYSLGKLQIFASHSSRVSSARVDIYDTIKYDIGTSANHKDSIWNNQSIQYLSRDYDCTTFTSSNINILYTEITAVDDYCIEFDFCGIWSVSSNAQVISLRDSNNTVITSVTKPSYSLDDNKWYHFSITVKDNRATISCESHTESNIDVSNTSRFYFRASSNETIKFKNFRMYNV